MATPQLSPGVLIREVDLTVGRAENVLDNVGAIAAPFQIGPIDFPIDVSNEQELLEFFGKPISTDNHYEYWLTASSFLSYGGVLKVVRTDGSNLVNANSKVTNASTRATGVADASLKIKNLDDYNLNHAESAASYVFGAKTPGKWANNLKVCFIDSKADQIITLPAGAMSDVAVGYGVSYGFNGEVLTSAGSTEALGNGAFLKGIITEKDTNNNTISVKVVSRVSSAGTVTAIDYAERSDVASFTAGTSVNVLNNSGAATTTVGLGTVKDWYDEQKIDLTNQDLFWKQIAPKPGTSVYADDRSGRNDEMHIVVIDDFGSLTGIKGNVIEKHLGLSKAEDAISNINSPQKIYYKDYLALFSEYVYAGDNPSDNETLEEVAQTGFADNGVATSFTGISTGDGLWSQNAQDVTFASIGNYVYSLAGGKDYSDTSGSMKASLADIATSYRVIRNEDEHAVDYLLMGPGCDSKAESQAKAQALIAIAEERKDCIAVISPHRADVIDVAGGSNAQTNNIIEFFSPLSSSSYAIFDSGYKYMYDRFNNKFRYVPTNGDVAGLCVRTSIQSFPWFSPAGQQRGVINNAIKLAYNPSKAERDKLYPNRINPITNTPGTGIILFGDKTALGYASAFDRINVRRLFLTIEQALKSAADAQLFELNDEITRANFVNIVEPYLRDVQAKRGIQDYVVICDETNNTPDVIDNNEFRADIFLKPAKSINFVTLTFVATRTGVSFEEVAGRV
jgi:hypothetical protein